MQLSWVRIRRFLDSRITSPGRNEGIDIEDVRLFRTRINGNPTLLYLFWCVNVNSCVYVYWFQTICIVHDQILVTLEQSITSVTWGRVFACVKSKSTLPNLIRLFIFVFSLFFLDTGLISKFHSISIITRYVSNWNPLGIYSLYKLNCYWNVARNIKDSIISIILQSSDMKILFIYDCLVIAA